MLSKQEEEQERKAVLRNDALVREQGGTFLSHTHSDAGGRLACLLWPTSSWPHEARHCDTARDKSRCTTAASDGSARTRGGSSHRHDPARSNPLVGWSWAQSEFQFSPPIIIDCEKSSKINDLETLSSPDLRSRSSKVGMKKAGPT
jgi:hypothetical protein